jgi:hypothetical protein
MATYVSNQPGRPPLNSTLCVGPWMDSCKVTPSAALALNDVIVCIEVPAGTRLETLRFYGGDFDTGTTLTASMGYRTKLPGGTATLATAFSTDATTLRAATTAWQELVFEPVKFNEPVQIIVTVSAAATGVSGTPSLYMQAGGVIEGIT